MILVGLGLDRPLCSLLVEAGFHRVSLEDTLGSPEWLDHAFSQFGADFRVRLVADQLDPLVNHLLEGVRFTEEIQASESIAPTAILTVGAPGVTPPPFVPVAQLSPAASHDREEVIHQVTHLYARLPRVSWDTYFVRICRQVALRSDCLKRHVAAIIVKEKRIVSTGYNGTPRGVANCSQGGCPRCATFGPSGSALGDCLCSHGEENAITQAAYHGISVKGATLYTTTSPCLLCTKMIINSGISEVVYNAAYPLGEQPLALLRTAGVHVRQAEIQE